MSCIEVCDPKEEGCNVPGSILDCTTLQITVDNQGVVTISFSILLHSKTPITTLKYVNDILPGTTFRGFIESDTPQRLQGSDFIEHQISARGAIC